jgi:hypothetical protein
MQLLTAKVKSNPRNVTTKHGERSVMDVILPDGTETAIWGPANFQAIHTCSQGQTIQLTKDAKNKLHIRENETAIAPKIESNQTQYQGMSNETKKQVASYITEMSNLFNFCLKQVDNTVENITPDDRRAIATSLFISAQKKYSL